MPTLVTRWLPTLLEIDLPNSLYQRLVEYLQAHAPTDPWAVQLLQDLEQEASCASRDVVKPAFFKM